MRKPIKKQDKDHTHRNTLTVGLFGGAMGGFIIAMMLGAFRATGIDSLTDWIVAVTAVGAALVSGLAVVLVALTLKATRDTLDATREMATDQKRIGEAQTRPWLLVESRKIFDNGTDAELEITIKNYGTTPATNVQFDMKMMAYDYDEDENGQPFRLPVCQEFLRTEHINAIGPSNQCKISKSFKSEIVHFGAAVECDVEVKYSSYDGQGRLYLSDYIAITTGDSGYIQIY